MIRLAHRAGLCISAGILSSALASAWQAPHWAEGFGGDVFQRCFAATALDMGHGPELFAFGQEPGGPQYGQGLRFDGFQWHQLPALDLPLYGAVVFDHGTGPELIGTGRTSFLVRLSGNVWSTFGNFQAPTFYPPYDLGPGTASALLVWDDGSGTALYVGGGFTLVDGIACNGIAKWDGTSWSTLGSGNGGTSCLALHDDGTGLALYSAGVGVQRWRNGVWTPLPGVGTGQYSALQSFDDGSGSKLYAGGNFPIGSSSTYLASWDGTSWTDVGAPTPVTAMIVHDQGAGPDLYVGHQLLYPPTPGGVRRLHAGNWTTLPLPTLSTPDGYPPRINDLESFQGRLWIAGTFDWKSSAGISNLQAWDGSTSRSAFIGQGTNGSVLTSRVLDLGNGPRLYAGGTFERAGTTPASKIASFDGTTWSSVAGAVNGSVKALEIWNDGGGTKLYAGGAFSSPGSCIARWDGTAWAQLGSGFSAAGGGYSVRALQAFDDGGGSRLYAGGYFDTAGGTSVLNVARWNGNSWSGVGSGIVREVNCFAVFDDGNGMRLYAGGESYYGGAAGNSAVVRWDGSTWSSPGSGLHPITDSVRVWSMCVHDDGTGPKLYVGGSIHGTNVERWDGTQWSAVGAGIPFLVDSLSVHDDGSGPKLYAGTANPQFTTPSAGVYVWDGVAWTALAGAPSQRHTDFVDSLASYDDPSPEPAALYAFGQFQGSGVVSSNVAKWSVASEDVIVCPGDGSGVACPCGNASTVAQAAGCLNSQGLAGALRTSGTASLSQDSLVLHGSSMGNGSALYFQGTVAIGLGAGTTFGDGLRCAGGMVKRLGTTMNIGGASLLPDVAHATPLSVAGSIPAGGGTRVYQAWYRNAAVFCTSATFNLTNGVTITWRP